MSRVFFSVWFSIQGIIQTTTCSVWFRIQHIIRNTSSSVCFRIQRIIKKCPGYYSASGSLFRILFKMRPAASGSRFSVLLKMSSLVQDSAYYSKKSRVLFSVWFRIQLIIKKCPMCYSESGSPFSVLLKLSRVLFSVWFRI